MHDELLKGSIVIPNINQTNENRQNRCMNKKKKPSPDQTDRQIRQSPVSGLLFFNGCIKTTDECIYGKQQLTSVACHFVAALPTQFSGGMATFSKSIPTVHKLPANSK